MGIEEGGIPKRGEQPYLNALSISKPLLRAEHPYLMDIISINTLHTISKLLTLSGETCVLQCFQAVRTPCTQPLG